MATTSGPRSRRAHRGGTAAPGDERAARSAVARRASGLFKSVSEPTRLQLLLALAEGERHVGDLRDRLGRGRPGVSHHLALLRHGGLIAPRREGNRNYYRLTDAGRSLADAVGGLAGPPAGDPGRPVRIPRSLLKEVGEVTSDPEGWMRRPNPRFEGRRPVELLGTPEEPRILLVIRAAQQGFFA